MPIEVVYAQTLLKKCCAAYWSDEANGAKLPKEVARAIGQAADEVVAGKHDDQFPLVIYQTGRWSRVDNFVHPWRFLLSDTRLAFRFWDAN